MMEQNDSDTPEELDENNDLKRKWNDDAEADEESDRTDSEETVTDAKQINNKRTRTLAKFHIDQAAIFERASGSSQLVPELASLGVTTIEQDQYEQGVIQQLEHAFDHEDEDSQDALKEEDDEVEENEKNEDSDYIPEEEDAQVSEEVEEESTQDHIDYAQCEELFIEDDCDRFEDAIETPFLPKKKRWSKEPLAIEKTSKGKASAKTVDDGCLKTYKKRLAEYRMFLLDTNAEDDPAFNEIFEIEKNFRIPKRIWERLFKHQQESLRWLWGLHKEHCGGIIGDEMGLGKTIQIIAFLVALKHSKSVLEFGEKYDALGPVLIVCPATVMHQWVQELHSWWPEFRVSILHSTGSFTGKKKNMIRQTFHENAIVITTYQSVSLMKESMVDLDWHYVILDEGHKIRNPEAQATKAVKLFKTAHRLILSGSPIQNNLRELWSLFDFVFPGKLGEMSTFMSSVAHPIRMGGYSGASELQIQVAYKSTLLLRDTIKPFLLRRTKDDVKLALNLPSKSEQVLFCKLTEEQKKIYQEYISSDFVTDLRQGYTRVFAALIKIRKICNHPHLFAPFQNLELNVNFDSMDFFNQAGKMSVVAALLKLWHKQKHKVLLFTQSKQMLDLLEKFTQLKEYSYLRMDGSTTLPTRQNHIRRFNEDPNVFVFLLTTKVGGLGVNLIGGDRVIIYDPDWNPCTDIQARERCWRIGQRRDVIIYRLLSAGTVEEKIYHRQIYKQYLTNSVLKNPHHRRFFKMNDMYDLFTISDTSDSGIMFSDSKVKFNDPKSKKKSALPVTKYSKQDISKKGHMISSQSTMKLPKIVKKVDNTAPIEVTLSDEKRQELREKARLLSQQLSEKFNNTNKNGLVNGESSTSSTSTKTEVKKKKKKKDGIKFEGKRIEFLVKQEDFQESDDEIDNRSEKKSKKKSEKNKDGKKEDYLLSKLMGKNQLDVVLQHDTIENVNVPDHYFIEREAEKIAQDALEKLRKSGTSMSQNQQSSTRRINIPQPSNFASTSSSSSMNSANLIAALRNRNKTNLTSSQQPQQQQPFFSPDKTKTQEAATNSNAITGDSLLIQDDFELMQELKNFVRYRSSKPYQASTQEILDYFHNKIPPQKSAVFKSMLRKLCFKETKQKGRAVWKLKSEFHRS